MKTVCAFLLLASCLIARAQTNNIPTFISFTNSSGDLITNAEVTKVLANKLFWKNSTGGGVIRIDALPEAVREQFNFDTNAAALADAKEHEKKQREIDQRTALAEQQAYIAQRSALEQNYFIIKGKVIQKIPEGLLVDSGREETEAEAGRALTYDDRGDPDYGFDRWHNPLNSQAHVAAVNNSPRSVERGLVLLVNYDGYANTVDDDYVAIAAYPIGSFTYTTANNSTKTVRKFTNDLRLAFPQLKKPSE